MLRTAAVAIGLFLALGNASADAQPAVATSAVVKPAKPPLYLRAQGRLKEIGDYKGPLNGRRDSATVAAIKKFQTVQKLPVSGRLTPETVKALGV